MTNNTCEFLVMGSVKPVNVDTSKFLRPWMKSAAKLETKCSDPVLLKMLEEGLLADITLRAKGGSVKAHRSVLAGVSPVFYAMFHHDMKETLASSVDILDMTIDALQLFLLLLYTTNEENPMSLVVQFDFMDAIDLHCNELFEAARKYLVGTRLGTVLRSTLQRNLTPHNCWSFWDLSMQPTELAASHSRRESASLECRDYILRNYDEVIKSESFLVEMKRHPERVYDIIQTMHQILRKKVARSAGR